jgi:hypothetical protein
MPRFYATTTIVSLGALFSGGGPADAATIVVIASDDAQSAEPRTVGLRDFVFSPADANYLQRLREETGNDALGRASRPARRIPLAE